MKRTLLMAALFLAVAATASAFDYGQRKEDDTPVGREYYLYPFAQYFIWEEFQGGTKLLKESGWQYGVGATATFTCRNVFYRLKGEFFAGHPDYDGQELFTGTPVTTDVVYYGGKGEADMGVTFRRGAGSVAPFWGLGYKAWQRDIANAGDVFGGSEWWDNFYAIVGLRGDFGPPSPGSLKGFVELAVKPHIINKNTADFPGLKTNVEPGHGFTASVEAGAKYRRVKASAFYEYTRWPESAPSTTVIVNPNDNSLNNLIQPETKQQLIGVKVGVVF